MSGGKELMAKSHSLKHQMLNAVWQVIFRSKPTLKSQKELHESQRPLSCQPTRSATSFLLKLKSQTTENTAPHHVLEAFILIDSNAYLITLGGGELKHEVTYHSSWNTRSFLISQVQAHCQGHNVTRPKSYNRLQGHIFLGHLWFPSMTMIVYFQILV